MSDLISRSELLEELKSLKIVLNGKQIFSDDAKDTVLRIVNEQPTAYDIDKVVEELEECSWSLEAKILVPNSNELGEYEEEVERKMICTQDAIEIVKQGEIK